MEITDAEHEEHALIYKWRGDSKANQNWEEKNNL